MKDQNKGQQSADEIKGEKSRQGKAVHADDVV